MHAHKLQAHLCLHVCAACRAALTPTGIMTNQKKLSVLVALSAFRPPEACRQIGSLRPLYCVRGGVV
jgi:hypothetical protein